MTRKELVRAELGESMDLFRQAATHAAGGLGATVGPRYGAVKERLASPRGVIGPAASRVTNAASVGWKSTRATFAPLAEAARAGSAKAGALSPDRPTKSGAKKSGAAKSGAKESGRRLPGRLMLVLVTGAAAGTAGALVARRRHRARWAEYDLAGPGTDASAMRDATVPTADETVAVSAPGASATRTATWAKDQTRSVVDTVRSKVRSAAANARGTAREAGVPVGDNAGPMKSRPVGRATPMADKHAGHAVDKRMGHLADKA